MSEFRNVGIAAQRARLEFAEKNPEIFDPIPVLDKGFVRLVDWMGNDSRIVQTARVSYGDGTKTLRQDAQLIRYLYRHAHTSPFEHVELAFHIKLPIFVFAQLVRHRMASVNAQSARYSVMQDEFYIPDEFRAQSKNNKQGSDGVLERTEELIESLTWQTTTAYSLYENYLEFGMAREQARMVLPQNLYTEVYWKQDLHNLFHMLKLRTDEHAQQEIRVYADAMYELTKKIVPVAVGAWEDYRRGSIHLSSAEVELLKYNSKAEFETAVTLLIEEGVISRGEAREIEQKFNRLNLWTEDE